MRYATVGGVLAAVGVGAALLTGGGSAQARLLDALKKQEKAKSYKCVQTVTRPPGLAEVVTIYFADGKARQERAGGPYAVLDTAAGTLTMIDPTAKTFAVVKNAGAKDPYAAMSEGARKAIAEGDRMQALGVQQVGKRKLKGYKFTRDPVGDVTPSSAFWLDPKDDTLVRYEAVSVPRQMFTTKKPDGTVETSEAPDQPKPVPVTAVFEFSGFGEPLDPKLFDATVPAGYKDVSANTHTMTAPPAKKPSDPAKK